MYSKDLNDQKMKYFNQRIMLQKNLEVVWEKESDYKEVIIHKYETALNEVKDKFRFYCSFHNIDLESKPNFAEARLGDGILLIRLEFPEIGVDEKYSFRLRIVEDNTREFFIFIIPKVDQLYIPKISKIRPSPKDYYQIKNSINELEREFLFLDEKKNEIAKSGYHFCYISEPVKEFNIRELTRYDDFIIILNNLLSN